MTRARLSTSVEALRADVDIQDALALSLLVAIQEAVDIAFHIAADEGWGVPSSYGEGFEILSRHGVIDAGLARELAAASALRNRIARGYASVDVERLWAEIPTGVSALDRYAAAIARFVPASLPSGRHPETRVPPRRTLRYPGCLAGVTSPARLCARESMAPWDVRPGCRVRVVRATPDVDWNMRETCRLRKGTATRSDVAAARRATRGRRGAPRAPR